MNNQLSEKEEDEQEEENDDNKGSSDDMEIENMEGLYMKHISNMTCVLATSTSNAPNGSSSDSKGMIFSTTLIYKGYHNLVTKLCNSKVIFGKFRIWINKEMDLALKKLQNELLLFDPSIAITPKRKEQPKIVYDTDETQLAVQNM